MLELVGKRVWNLRVLQDFLPNSNTSNPKVGPSHIPSVEGQIFSACGQMTTTTHVQKRSVDHVEGNWS